MVSSLIAMSVITSDISINYNLDYSKLEISVTEHLVDVVDKLSTTAVVFFRSEGY